MPSSYYTSVTSLSQSLLQSSVISINTNNIPINHLIFPADETRKKCQIPSTQSEYEEIGVPTDWVERLQKLGYTTIDKLKAVEKQGNLANDLNGY